MILKRYSETDILDIGVTIAFYVGIILYEPELNGQNLFAQQQENSHDTKGGFTAGRSVNVGIT